MMVEPDRTVDGVQDARTPTRARRFVLPALLLLALLLFSCFASTVAFYRAGPASVRVATRDAACLSCHTEVLPQMAKPSVHAPFGNHQCTSCHNEHAKIVRVTVGSQAGTAGVTAGVWLRWGPFRWLIGSLQRTVFRVGDQAQTAEEKTVLGPATLIAPPDSLCSVCHANIAADRTLPYQHWPFATNHCLDCHNAHASDNKPLLNSSPDSLCMTCHPMLGELDRTYTHKPAEQHHCLTCHKAHSSEWPGVLTASQRDLCFSCHPDVAQLSNMPVQHQPFDADDCTQCHEPHGSDTAQLLDGPTPQLCYGCHTAMQARFARASHHPVGTTIDCTSCHQPHASANAGLLVLAERQLCTSCHSDVGAQSALSVQHSPFQTKPCTTCHVPHGSEYRPLLKNPEPNLCEECHQTQAEEAGLPSHHPPPCSQCHRPHASSYQNLLVAAPGNGLCYRCHSSVSLTYLTSKHSVIECLKCHTPHGSQWGSLLRTEPPEVCSQCHPRTAHLVFVGNGDVGHQAAPTFYDPHAGKPLTCTSSCHNPHGTIYGFMVRDMPFYKDGLCLRCHPGVGVRF